MVDNPITRKEKYLAKLTGSYTGNIPDPITRVEKYLYDLCQKGINGLTPEEIENAVNKYLKENPVQPGATEEQAQQIKKNADDVASLKEDISTKITKFYASSQGENHLADSDNGKIMDMMVYGKSEQKQYSGKNLLNATLGTTTRNGVTCTANGDGTYTLNGTATSKTEFKVIHDIVLDTTKTYKLCGRPNVGSGYSIFCGINASPRTIYGSDSGGGVTFTPSSPNGNRVMITITSGTSFNNVIFKPMLTTDLTATYDDFEPYTGGIPSPNPDYPQEIKSVVNPTVKLSNEDGTQFKTVTLPYTLNAIPVNSGGNVTIDGQQYIADYVDVERGKLVRMVKKKVLNGTENWNLSERSENRNGVFHFFADANIAGALCDKAIYESLTSHYGTFDTWYNQIRFYAHTDEMTVEEWRNFLSSNNHVIYIVRNTPVKTDLTKEEITAFKALTTYYPTTNIFINSEQLDGYTVFNYPISMENGWNYVKQQIGDTREYIYDMDARAQDTDLQAAEAYVNSEYAVALAELEV